MLKDKKTVFLYTVLGIFHLKCLQSHSQSVNTEMPYFAQGQANLLDTFQEMEMLAPNYASSFQLTLPMCLSSNCINSYTTPAPSKVSLLLTLANTALPTVLNFTNLTSVASLIAQLVKNLPAVQESSV